MTELNSNSAALKGDGVVRGRLFKADGEPLVGDSERIKNDGVTLNADRRALKDDGEA